MSNPRIAVFLCIIALANGNYFGTSRRNNDQCFCKLKGSIDDCTCSVDTVDYFNNMRIYPRIQSLLVRDYFRFYKVNLTRECPFWADDSKCAMRSCHVQPCHDKDIPPGLKGDAERRLYLREKPVDKYTSDFNLNGCAETERDHNKELGYLNTTISSENYKEFQKWQMHDDAQDNFCITETSPGEYVDLLLNPERYTGYKGPSAHRIWRTIYMENCFRPENSPHNFIQSSKVNGMCLEKRTFYRVVSGLHSSINIHLCAKYLLSATDSLDIVSTGGQWGPNLKELLRRFSPEETGNEGPNWLKNLYFIYLLELRALEKAAPYLEHEEYYTGNEYEDEDTRMAVHDVLNVVRHMIAHKAMCICEENPNCRPITDVCPMWQCLYNLTVRFYFIHSSFSDHFNESVMFNGGAQSKLLKEEFRQHFRNISVIMDCVGCDKCKLWGKLQIQGLGTALKILFSGKFDKWESTVRHPIDRRHFFLERSEIVALVNSFGRLSESIFELDRFRKMMR